MAKGKKRSSVQARTTVSQPRSKSTTMKADSPKGIQGVVDGAEVHVSIKQNDKQAEAVQLKLSYDEGKPAVPTPTTTSTAVDVAAPTPVPATPVATKASVPTKPAEPAVNGGAVAKVAAAAPAPAAAAAPVAKRSFMSPSGILNADWTRYIDLVAQAYTYPAYYTAGAAVGVISAVTTEISNHLPTVITKRIK